MKIDPEIERRKRRAEIPPPSMKEVKRRVDPEEMNL